jgi:hypothetical protein
MISTAAQLSIFAEHHLKQLAGLARRPDALMRVPGRRSEDSAAPTAGGQFARQFQKQTRRVCGAPRNMSVGSHADYREERAAELKTS